MIDLRIIRWQLMKTVVEIKMAESKPVLGVSRYRVFHPVTYDLHAVA